MWASPVRIDHGQSALSAFRSDLPPGGRPASEFERCAILVAALLQHAAHATTAADARRSRAAAERTIHATLGRSAVRTWCSLDEPGSRSPNGIYRMVVHRANRNGNLSLADSILDSLSAMTAPETLEWGRLQFHRGAVYIRRGMREPALVTYQQVRRLARKLDSVELAARAEHGTSMVMWIAGNLPAARRLARRAIQVAGRENGQLRGAAMMTLSTTAALRGDFDEALSLAWEAHRLTPRDPVFSDHNLGNIAQILMDAGYPEPARAVFKRMLGDGVHQGTRLAAVSGYAAASAALGDVEAVEWALQATLKHADTPVFPREIADALLECSYALDQIGRHSRAATIRSRALRLARRYGFHEIAYLAEQGIPRGAPARPRTMTPTSRAILTEIREMETEGLPLIGAHAD